MIDHVLGRPSVKFRKYQVFAVVAFWSMYLYRGNSHGPPLLRRLSKIFSTRLTAWQTIVTTLLWLYISRNFGKLVGLECPEPLSNLYTRSYFRATWVTTALDAGFWSAMRVRRKWARDLLSIVFSIYYLICAEQADEKVRKVRATLTVEHLRVSWNKGTTPYLAFFTGLLRPRFMRYPPRALRITRPAQSSYTEPIHAWLYFDGPLSALKRHNKIVLDIPGGGFVAMNPRTHDDKLIAWAGKTGLPVLSLDYRKAPEYPYPYALNECYDAYHTIVATQGRCIGLSGTMTPHIVVSGDSAGGNLAVGMVLMLLQSGSTGARRWHGEKALPMPEGLILVYPALDMNIGNWMTDEQMALIRDRRTRKTNKGVLRRKSEDYRKLTPSQPSSPLASEDEDLLDEDSQKAQQESSSHKSPTLPKSVTQTDLRQESESSLAESPTAIRLTDSPTAIHLTATHTTATAPTVIPNTQPDIHTAPAAPPTQLKTRLAVSSMISYFSDRILTPELMRAMIILYIGPHNRPDFGSDFLLSPLLAPEQLLSSFPKTYFLTGERDPLVDDTVIFAGRIRQAKYLSWVQRRDMGVLSREEAKKGFREEDCVEVLLVPGISHGFLQFVAVFPEGWKYISRCAKWMREVFERVDRDEVERTAEEEYDEDERRLSGWSWGNRIANGGLGGGRHHRRVRTMESSGDEDRPLEMSLATPKGRDRKGSSASEKRRNGESGRGRRLTGAMRPVGPERQKSLVSLASEDDLLGRRMKGLAGSLMGITDEDDGGE